MRLARLPRDNRGLLYLRECDRGAEQDSQHVTSFYFFTLGQGHELQRLFPLQSPTWVSRLVYWGRTATHNSPWRGVAWRGAAWRGAAFPRQGRAGRGRDGQGRGLGCSPRNLA